MDGIEVEVGVLGNRTPPPQASLPGEIVAHGFGGTDWYDWSAKYDDGGMDLIVPPRIPEDVSQRVQDVAVAAFLAADCEGMARVDCFVTPAGDVLVRERLIPSDTSQPVQQLPAMELDAPLARVIGETGVVMSRLKPSAGPALNATFVFVRQQSAWKLAAIHFSPTGR